MSLSSLWTEIRSIADGESSRSRRKLAIARSTLVQVVFWVRIAPTITSNGLFAGHQF